MRASPPIRILLLSASVSLFLVLCCLKAATASPNGDGNMRRLSRNHFGPASM